jgi:hypothetical protein
MQYRTRHTHPLLFLRIVFTLVLACCVSQGTIAASGQNSGTPSFLALQDENSVPVVGAATKSTVPNTFANQAGNSDIRHSIPISRDTVEIMVMSGLFALIGTFFIPHLLSYL